MRFYRENKMDLDSLVKDLREYVTKIRDIFIDNVTSLEFNPDMSFADILEQGDFIKVLKSSKVRQLLDKALSAEKYVSDFLETSGQDGLPTEYTGKLVEDIVDLTLVHSLRDYLKSENEVVGRTLIQTLVFG